MQASGAVDGVNFQGMSSAVMNGDGKVAFTAFLQNLAGDVARWIADRGIWTDAGGELKLVARSGLQLLTPGDPAELKVGTPVPGYSSITTFSLFSDYDLEMEPDKSRSMQLFLIRRVSASSARNLGTGSQLACSN